MWARITIQIALLMVAWATVWPARSHACTCNPQTIYRSDPEAGTRDVALNQAITVEGAYGANSIVFEDEAGAVVEYDSTVGPAPTCPGTSAELVPRKPLAPNTTYVIRVQPLLPGALGPEDMNTLTFVTGDRMLRERALEVPIALASMISNTPQSGFSCGKGEFTTCVSVDDYEDVEVLAKRQGETIMRWVLRGEGGNFLFQVAPDCMEFRRRGPTGKRSAVVAICGEQLGLRPFRPSDLRQGVVQCHAGKIGEDAPPTAELDAGVPTTSGPDGGVPDTQTDASSDTPRMASSSIEQTAARPNETGAGSSCAVSSALGQSRPSMLWLAWLLAFLVRRTRRGCKAARRP